MSSAWSRQKKEPALAWMDRLRRMDFSALDESYRRALADFTKAARQAWHQELENPEPEESAALASAKDAFLRLDSPDRAQLVQWLKEIGVEEL